MKKQITSLQMVKEFNLAFGHPVLDTPKAPSAARQRLRTCLVLEETAEVIEALANGASNCQNLLAAAKSVRNAIIQVREAPDYEFLNPDLENLAKELADSKYVVDGMALEFGIPLDQVTPEVHRSNMSKCDPVTGKPVLDQHGKIQKGEHYSKPDIKSILWPLDLDTKEVATEAFVGTEAE